MDEWLDDAMASRWMTRAGECDGLLGEVAGECNGLIGGVFEFESL